LRGPSVDLATDFLEKEAYWPVASVLESPPPLLLVVPLSEPLELPEDDEPPSVGTVPAEQIMPMPSGLSMQTGLGAEHSVLDAQSW
jgi:hypothetical protein